MSNSRLSFPNAFSIHFFFPFLPFLRFPGFLRYSLNSFLMSFRKKEKFFFYEFSQKNAKRQKVANKRHAELTRKGSQTNTSHVDIN